MHYLPRTTGKSGFSLVELSIVLVILGLLVGSVLSGQSLIRAAEMRSISSEYQRYTTAMSSFRDKYFALPGDMSNATSFWATSGGVGSGDGDGLIKNSSTAASNEISEFWIHLAKASLVEGSYTNLAASNPIIMTAGTNNPRSKMKNAGWNVTHLGTVDVAGASSPSTGTRSAAADVFFDGTYGNVLILNSGTDPLASGGILKAEEAWNLDTKMDDGKPATGSVTTLEAQGSGVCSDLAADNTTTRSTAVYSLGSTSSTACSLVFKTGY